MYSDIAANKRKTVFIMLIFVAFVVGLVWLLNVTWFGGNNDVFYIAVAASIVYAIITYYSGSRLALSVNGAMEIQKSDNPRLWRIIENLSITDGLPMPRVFIINDPSPNAFATGRDPKHAAVCATSGLLDMMTDDELQGVFAHELGHVKNYDIRVSMIAFALSMIISLVADIMLRMTWFRNNDRNEGGQAFVWLGIIAAILAPVVASLIQLAVSRQREYLADATSALTTRYPEGLISALTKIGQNGQPMRRQSTATAHLFFTSPLQAHTITNLFSTHPPIADRIARLQNMEGHA